MHLVRAGSLVVLISILALAVLTCAGVCEESIAISDTTMEIRETGAIHYKMLQTIPASRDGITTSHFELQKQFRPENLSVYDYATGKPLAYTIKDYETAFAYDVSFDRPYFTPYTYVIEYDNHNRIIDEGKGVYSIGMRPAVNINKVDRISTVVLPPANFTYLDYNHALDKPASVQQADGRTIIRFRNVSSAPADYAWEIKFRATGIKDELRKPESDKMTAIPGMTAFLSIFVLIAVARLIRQ